MEYAQLVIDWEDNNSLRKDYFMEFRMYLTDIHVCLSLGITNHRVKTQKDHTLRSLKVTGTVGRTFSLDMKKSFAAHFLTIIQTQGFYMLT